MNNKIKELIIKGKVKNTFYLDIVAGILYVSCLFSFAYKGLYFILFSRFIYIAITTSTLQLWANKCLLIKKKTLYELYKYKVLFSFILALLNFSLWYLLKDKISPLFILLFSVSLSFFLYLLLLKLKDQRSYFIIVTLIKKLK